MLWFYFTILLVVMMYFFLFVANIRKREKFDLKLSVLFVIISIYEQNLFI